ncbi:MAG TPA: Ig-like domain-containing protein, partial [Solirubrobacterales bacterium]|nr:Ig-like domain-containing protein [Solirubrobacterales bacterium]
TATVNSDAMGIATSPAVIANLQVGAWQVEAGVSGVVPVDFGLTNTARPTGTALRTSSNPALAGESVTFTATVEGTSGGPEPSGSVQFTSDGSALGAPVPLSGGSAQKAAELPVGSHTVEAVFQPDEGFETSQAKLTEKVEKATSAIEVASSKNPSGFGEAVAFTAHVAHSGSHAATGTVQFELDGAALGAPVAVAGGTATSESVSTLSVSSHELVATYSGDEFVAGSKGKLTQSVGADATATEMAASVNPSLFGQAVTFTATVKAQSGDTPTGQITFLIDGVLACEGTLSGGSATCSPGAPLAPGEHDVRAEYAGDADFSPSHGLLTETVAKASTATSISADVAVPRFGQPVTFTAAVSVPAPGGGVPTGEVQFTLDGEPLGAPVTITGGAATTPPIATLPVGIDAVGAEYSGDPDHTGSGETLFEEVVPGATTTILASSANPTHFGVPVIFSALVEPAAPASGQPAGTVRFTLDGKAICDVPLSAGEATCKAPTLYAGDHRVIASYSGEANFEASDGKLTESIVRVPSHTVASTSSSPALAGQPVTLSADVVGGLPDETPAGTVSFRSGGQLLGTAPVHPTVPGAGRADLETSSLPTGSHEIVATYSGDDAIEPSSAPPFTQTIDGKALALETPGLACTAPNVRARILVFRRRGQVRLVVRNRAAAPAQVTVRFEDEHGPGAKLLGKLSREVSGDGMVRVVERLAPAEMKRLRRARDGFAADVAIAARPGGCASESSRPLSVRRLVSGQRVWFQHDSIRQELPKNTR